MLVIFFGKVRVRNISFQPLMKTNLFDSIHNNEQILISRLAKIIAELKRQIATK